MFVKNGVFGMKKRGEGERMKGGFDDGWRRHFLLEIDPNFKPLFIIMNYEWMDWGYTCTLCYNLVSRVTCYNSNTLCQVYDLYPMWINL